MTRPTVLDMDLVVVPREADVSMQTGALRFVMRQHQTRDVYRAMLSASPYPTAWDDVRKYVEGLERSLATCEADRVDRIEQCDRMANDWADFCASVGVTWDTHESVACEIEARAEARIAELEKRLADADVVIKPFAECASEWDGQPASLHVFFEWNDEGKPAQSLPVADFRAARAYMEGK